MSARLTAFLLAALLGLLPLAAPAQRAALPLEDPDGARVIVKYKALGPLMRAQRASGAASGPQLAATLAQRHALALADGRAIGERTQVVRGDLSLSSAALAARLAADPDVEYASPDYRRHALAVTPNDPLYPAQAAGSTVTPAAGQWYLRAPDATLVSAINAPAAWAVTTGASGIVIADLDTGARFDHPDLAGKLLPGRNFVSTNGVAGQGWSADASDPGDWTTANQCGRGIAATTSSWHGTQTAGIMGAQTGNGVGIASVGWGVMVMPVRVLGPCGGGDSDIQAAMLWAGGLAVAGAPANPNPARIINLSLGGSGSCTAAYADVVSRLTAAGVVVVVAAGNAEGLAVSSPGNCAGVVTVAALRNVGTKVGFSSIGPEVAIAAPGGNCINTSGACLYPIVTTTNAGSTTPAANTYTNGLGDPSLGTSFATPQVSGVVALMLAANPALTPAQLRSKLQASARAFPATSTDPAVTQCHAPTAAVQDECICTTSTCGAGMLDAGAAVVAAAAAAPPSVAVTASAATVTVGTGIDFSASASAPAGRSIASYRWVLTTGSAIAAFSGAADGATARVATTGTGPLAITVTVTDSSGAQASASATVNVNPPAAPAASIVPSASVVAAGTSVSFDGSGSTANGPAQVAGYAWTLGAQSSPGLAQFSSAINAATATVATAGNASGSFTVNLAVTDSFGQTATTSRSVSVTALGPTATLAGGATAAKVGESLVFDGSGSTAPAGRTIAGYQWSLAGGNGVASFTGGTTGATATVTADAVGSFMLALTVVDSAGAQSTRSTTVTVSAATIPGSTGGGGSSSTGGGAVDPGWLLALAAAVAALAGARRR